MIGCDRYGVTVLPDFICFGRPVARFAFPLRLGGHLFSPENAILGHCNAVLDLFSYFVSLNVDITGNGRILFLYLLINFSRIQNENETRNRIAC